MNSLLLALTLLLGAPGGEVRLQVVQRHTGEIPGFDGALRLRLDDITRGQVYVTVEPAGGGLPLVARSMQPGDEAQFRQDGAEYVVRLEKLANYLVGDDYADLTVRPAGMARAAWGAPAATGDTVVAARTVGIEELLADVGRSNVTFIREGAEHSPSDAVEHLRRKLQGTGGITTVEAFIEKLASRSSLTGQPYFIKHPDGRTEHAEAWFKGRVEALKGR